nr:RHS repeat-associated core domain-containing protein [Streptococcus suis]
MTKDGNPVASSSYNLYGSTKKSTDITGNPFAYNGEARDATGLDYLRARYYDSSAGTFLTEDSYQGQVTDPLSQNRYSYVHNNPVNYNDPSGHFWNSIKKAASNVWNGVKKTASNAWNGVKKTASNAWNGVKKTASNAWNGVTKVASNAWNTVKRVATNTWNSVKSAYNTTVNWVSNKVNQSVNWVGQQTNRVYHAGQQVYQSASSYAQAQYQQLQAQIQARREQAVRNEYAQATGIKGTPKSREAMNLLRNWGAALAKTLKHVCTTANRVGKQIMKAAKKIDWKKVAVTAGAIGVGIALTVATGGLGAPIAMAIGGAASGALMSGYDAYTSGQRGWALAGSVVKGAGTGALAGFIGGQFMGAGASVAANVTQNIGHQTVRQVAKIGVEATVETAIDTGIDLATGNKITGQTVAMNFAFNTFTNGAGSFSSKKGTKADVNTSKPKAGDVNRTPKVEIQFSRNSKHDADEFSRQLKNQQDGMNKLTVKKYRQVLYFFGILSLVSVSEYLTKVPIQMWHFRVLFCPIKTHRSCEFIGKTQLDCPACSLIFGQAASKVHRTLELPNTHHVECVALLVKA